MLSKVGPFDVDGPVDRVTLVEQAIASLDPDVDIDRLHPKRAKITFGQVALIPGTSKPAAGYTVSGPNYRVRHDMDNAPNLSKHLTKYVVIHESLGHGRLIIRPLNDQQQRRCLALLDGPPIPKFADPDEVWRKVKGEEDYWLRPYECIIDSLVEALSSIESPLRRQYRRHVRDLNALKAIWLEGLAAPAPVASFVEPAPPPLPEPVDPWVVIGRIKALADAALEGRA